MARNRTGLAPWSLSREAGVQSATVDGTIEVPQTIQPTLNTGFVDEKGDWKGVKSSDEVFHSFAKDEGIPNTGEILAPQATGSIWPLDMTGYNDIQIAIRPTNGGNYAIKAIMGPATFAYANLRDVNAGATLRGNTALETANYGIGYSILNDASEALTADVWNLFIIVGRLSSQKLLQFSITNNSGGESDIETAFMRLV